MKEMYAISWGINELRMFLLGRKFKIKTDHKPLLGIVKKIDAIKNAKLLSLVVNRRSMPQVIEN